jgi:DNA-binding transcriptional ArsR family regulator
MAKKSGAKKKVFDKATTSKTVGAVPHHEGFHGVASPVSESIEETKLYHTRYLRAINSPVRREILKALKEGCATIEDLQSSTGLDKSSLEWHLNVLEHGFCVEKDIKQGKLVYRLTQEGKVVDYME